MKTIFFRFSQCLWEVLFRCQVFFFVQSSVEVSLNPIQVGRDSCVDSRVRRLAATDSPADDSGLHPFGSRR